MKTPFLIVTAKEDTVVRNSTTTDVIMKNVNNPKNKLVEIERADHLNITLDHEYVKTVVDKSV